MAAESTTAIVLRLLEFSETSYVVTLLTRDFGKLTGLAKGARRRKSPFEGALDLLSVCHVVLLRKSSDAMSLLTEAKLIRRFRAGSRDLGRLYAGYFIAELLLALTDDGDPHPELFDLADRSLIALEEGSDPVTRLAIFQMQTLGILGHQPALQRCVGCGQRVPNDPRVSISMIEGGVLCAKCRVGKRHVVAVSDQTRSILQQMSSGQEPPEVTVPGQRGEIRGLLEQYITHLLGYRPKLLPYLRATLK